MKSGAQNDGIDRYWGTRGYKNAIRATPEFSKFLGSLRSGKRRREIDRILDMLKDGSIRGDKIRRGLWPKPYVRKYGILNLYRIELSGGWRMTYTVLAGKQFRAVMVLEVFDHKKYEGRFGY